MQPPPARRARRPWLLVPLLVLASAQEPAPPAPPATGPGPGPRAAPGAARARPQGARPRPGGAAPERARPGAAAQAPAARIAFRWGAAGSVPVRETATIEGPNGDVDLVATYRVSWATGADGDVTVTRTPRSFESLGGVKVPPDADPLMPLYAEDLLAPTVVVQPSGRFARFGGHDPDAVLEILEAHGETRLAEALRAARGRPDALLRARERARELWEAWLGAWVGAELEPGAPRELSRQAYVGLGTATLPARLRVSCDVVQGQGPARCARLDLRVSHAGGDFPALAALAVQALPEGAAPEGALRARQLQLRGTFEVETARPRRVQARTTRVYADESGGTRSIQDVREYAFDWSRAKVQGVAQAAGARPGAVRAGGRPAGGAGADPDAPVRGPGPHGDPPDPPRGSGEPIHGPQID